MYDINEILTFFLALQKKDVVSIRALYADFTISHYRLEHRNGAIYHVEFNYHNQEIRIQLNDQPTITVPKQRHRAIFDHFTDITRLQVQGWS